MYPPLFPTLREFYYGYQLPLAHALYHVEQRGMMVNVERLAELKQYIYTETETNLDVIKSLYGKPVSVYKAKNALCLNHAPSVAKLLKYWGLKVPISRQTHRETTDETTLQRIYGETSHAGVKALLNIRELVKILGYVKADLYNGVLYCSYVSIGTVTGRRASRQNFVGLGTNQQNIPKHSALGKMYRRCLTARPGKVFVACDQKGAEDWIVQGIIADVTGHTTGLDELRAGINRHKRLAGFVFAKPEEECTKDTLYYYLGKRTRHAGQYGMRGAKMSEVLAKEGFAVPGDVCNQFIAKFHQFEPFIQKGFQKYVEDELCSKRQLCTTIGRRRQFLSLRSHSDNSTIFREGYAQIPQSTVGDNTGLAIVWMERAAPGLVIADGHDAVYTEVAANINAINNATELLARSFDRTLTFPVSGVQVNIPVEYELGLNLKDMVTFDPGVDNIKKALVDAIELDSK